MANRVGQQLGNYRLTRFLAGGGFGDVYLAEHLFLPTQTAIKVLNAGLTSPQDQQQFLKEARIIASLEHPHIVRVLDFGVERESGTPYLVMEYAVKGTLRQPTGTRLAPATILPYVRQVASALQFAHDHKVIHRDVRPENMLVNAQGKVLLSDFGLAVVERRSSQQSTQKFIGTPTYAAPEQYREKKPVPNSDQYALGVVVYEWLAGACPFEGDFLQVMWQHVNDKPPAFHEKHVVVSPEIEQVVRKALEKNPDERYPNVLAFADALEQACQPARFSGPTTQPRPTVPDPFAPTPRVPPPVTPLAVALPPTVKDESRKPVESRPAQAGSSATRRRLAGLGVHEGRIRLAWLVPSVAADGLALIFASQLSLLVWLLIIAAASAGFSYAYCSDRWYTYFSGGQRVGQKVILLLSMGIPVAAAVLVFGRGWPGIWYDLTGGFGLPGCASHGDNILLTLLSFLMVLVNVAAGILTFFGVVVTPIGLLGELIGTDTEAFSLRDGCLVLLIGAACFLTFHLITTFTGCPPFFTV